MHPLHGVRGRLEAAVHARLPKQVRQRVRGRILVRTDARDDEERAALLPTEVRAELNDPSLYSLLAHPPTTNMLAVHKLHPLSIIHNHLLFYLHMSSLFIISLIFLLILASSFLLACLDLIYVPSNSNQSTLFMVFNLQNSNHDVLKQIKIIKRHFLQLSGFRKGVGYLLDFK